MDQALGELATNLSADDETADELSLTDEGKRQQGTVPEPRQGLTEVTLPSVWRFRKVGDLDGLVSVRQSSHDALPLSQGCSAEGAHDLLLEIMGRPWTKLVAAIIALADNRRVRSRELGGASHHRSQDRLEIQRRRHRWTAVAQCAELRLASLVGRGCHVKPPRGARRRMFLAPPYAV